MPSRMNVRAVWLRTPSQNVVLSGRARRSSNENVVGSDFTSQYRFSPGFLGAKTQAHELSARNGPAGFFAGFRFQGTGQGRCWMASRCRTSSGSAAPAPNARCESLKTFVT